MPAPVKAPRSIRSQMLFTVNSVLMTALLIYLAIDYRDDWHKRLVDKRGAMMEEARLLAPAVVRLSRFVEQNQNGLGRPSVPLRPMREGAAEPVADGGGPTTEASDANLTPAERRVQSIVGRAVAPGPGRRMQNVDGIAGFLRSVCERKQVPDETNYQLAVRIGDHWYQAKKSNKHALVPLTQIDEGVGSKQGVAVEGDTVLIVRDSLDDGAVFVVESLTRMMHQARTALLWHMVGIAFIGLGVTAIVNLVLVRLVSEPLRTLVTTVRRIKTGEFGIKAPPGSSSEVESLVGEVNQLSQSLQRAEADRVRQMDKARRVQERLFPSEASAGPLKVKCVHTAASIVGGDYFDHKVMPDGSIMVIVVDVSGHGVPAAMGAAMLKALFDSHTRNTADLLELIAAINHGFCEVSLDEDFATIIIVKIDPALRRLQYVNAGHETGYVIPSGSNETCTDLREMQSTGPLVGVMRDAEWTVGELLFEPGDRAVLLTDGVIECRSLAGGMLGRKRACAMLLRASALPLEAFSAQVMSDIEAFRAGLAPSDDLTLLTLEF